MSEDKTKPDLTRIEDLSEFLHQDDPETDALLEGRDDQQDENNAIATGEDLSSIDSLDDDQDGAEEEIFALGDEDSFNDDQETQSDFQMPELPQENDMEDEVDEEEFQTDFQSDSSLEEDSGFESNFDDGFETSFEDNQDDETEDAFEEDDQLESFDQEETLNFDQDGESIENEDDSYEFDEGLEEEQEDDQEDEQEESLAFEQSSDNESPSEEDYNIQESASEQIQQEAPAQKERENFEDLRRFSENITYGNVAQGGNPPFSIVLKKIKYLEDGEQIIEILEEHGLVNTSNKAVMQQSIQHGTLLLSQLSEYAAIYLCHKLRRFDLEILMGLSEEIRPSKSYENEEKGLIAKTNLNQNKNIFQEFEEKEIAPKDILVTLAPQLENMQIVRYIDIVTSHKIVSEHDLRRNQNEDDQMEKFELDQSEVFDQLKEQLRLKAHALKANALIGLNYQTLRLSEGEQSEFKITCSANAVWIMDRPGSGVY
ncbi:hypothetical protein HBN50_08525 [Halobacteriovorax sp. GB3]|uniref:hypothetical protein n=1 Tax=Halobacteriovorax sp. GB3 TaxID=2719615 RepID=UPI002362B955|nr:hypothetical protein [Halobacteriovorax sp. GB3]MDD0853139.1 hypothetical protein [Halobacteriovorax sp. GB3]